MKKMVRLKFELTNQDSAGGKNCTVLMLTGKKSNPDNGDGNLIFTKGIHNSKNHTRWIIKSEKNMKCFCLQAFNLASKMSRPRLPTCSSIAVVANICVILGEICCSSYIKAKIKHQKRPKQLNCCLYFLLAAKKKTVIVSLR